MGIDMHTAASRERAIDLKIRAVKKLEALLRCGEGRLADKIALQRRIQASWEDIMQAKLAFFRPLTDAEQAALDKINAKREANNIAARVFAMPR